MAGDDEWAVMMRQAGTGSFTLKPLAADAVQRGTPRRGMSPYQDILAHADARPTALAVAGGVAANKAIRAMLETVSAQVGVPFLAPPLRLCTDNAAMIAWAGIERLRAGVLPSTDFVARPRWPLDLSAPALLGSGKKGAKA